MNRDFYNYNYYPGTSNYYTTSSMSPSYYSSSGDRFIGAGFVAPFLLGGLAGAALARPWGGFVPYPYPYPYCCYW